MQDHVTEVLQFLQGEQAAAKSKKEEHHMQSSEDNEYEQMKTQPKRIISSKRGLPANAGLELHELSSRGR